jgi:hypothetical protein
MKRIFCIALLALTAAVIVSAQQRGPPGYGRGEHHGPGYRAGPRETVTVTGSLELIDGTIALKQDTVTYYVMGLNRLTGFIDGLKEGAAVTLEGSARRLPGEGERRALLVSRLEINGKTYDNLTPALRDRPEKPSHWNTNPRQGPGRRRDSPRNPERGSRNSGEGSAER